jgi:hypothetical protein
VVALGECPDRERGDEGSDEQQRDGDRTQDEQPTALAVTVLQPSQFGASAADPRDQELAGDLVEVQVTAPFAAHEP